MSQTKTKVAKGIYRCREDRYYEVRWPNAFGKTVSKMVRVDEWPGAEGLKKLKEWRTKQKSTARGDKRIVDVTKGAFARKVEVFLQGRKKLPIQRMTLNAECVHLRSWVKVFKGGGMDVLTTEALQKQVDKWRITNNPRTGKPLALKTVMGRLNILSRFCRKQDPSRVPPTEAVTLWKDNRDMRVLKTDASVELVKRIALQLRQRELDGRLYNMKTRARFLLLATTGIRPTQIMATPESMVDLTADIPYWMVPRGKNDHGTMIPLRGELLEAMKLFVAAKAWGHFHWESFRSTLQRNGWPKSDNLFDGPYRLRRSVFNAMKRAGRSSEQIGEYSGHKKSDTLNMFYIDAVDMAGVHATVATVEHRLGLIGTAAFDTALPVRKSFVARKKQARLAARAA